MSDSRVFLHLVLYDAECGFCNRSVQILLKIDKKKLFCFAPLGGKSARRFGLSSNQKDSLILIENYASLNPTIFKKAKAILTIAWLVGSYWKLIGSLSFLPGWLFDWVYTLIASRRYRFFSQDPCVVPSSTDKERFLP